MTATISSTTIDPPGRFAGLSTQARSPSGPFFSRVGS